MIYLINDICTVFGVKDTLNLRWEGWREVIFLTYQELIPSCPVVKGCATPSRWRKQACL